jgi:peptidylprolyl isomerase
MASRWIGDRRLHGLVVLLALSLLLSACGNDASSTTVRSKPNAAQLAKAKPKVRCGPPNKSMRFTGRPGAKDASEPDVRPPCGPPPKKLVVADLEEGSGHPAAPGDEVVLRFVGARYKTGKVFYGSWTRQGVFAELGENTRPPGLEAGLRGMKAGGRRELIVPPALTDDSGPLIYIIDVLKVEAR